MEYYTAMIDAGVQLRVAISWLNEKDQTQEGSIYINLNKNPNQTKQLTLAENV